MYSARFEFRLGIKGDVLYLTVQQSVTVCYVRRLAVGPFLKRAWAQARCYEQQGLLYAMWCAARAHAASFANTGCTGCNKGNEEAFPLYAHSSVTHSRSACSPRALSRLRSSRLGARHFARLLPVLR